MHFLTIILRKPHILIASIAVTLLSGCVISSNSTKSYTKELSVSPDSSLTLNQKIDFKPGKTRVFLQDGMVVSQFNHYKSNCNLEIRKKDEENWQFVEPGVYKVISTRQTLEEVVRFIPGNETRVASRLILADIDTSQTDIYLGMHYYLSGEDANVMRLSCRGVMALPHEAEPPTLQEIRQALGNIITLNL